MDSHTKIAAIKELRARCDLTLVQAKDTIEAYAAEHPRASFGEMIDAVAAVSAPRPPTVNEEIAQLRAQCDVLRASSAQLISHLYVLKSCLVDECDCLEPPATREPPEEPSEPSAHQQYCPQYLRAYIDALIDGTPTPA